MPSTEIFAGIGMPRLSTTLTRRSPGCCRVKFIDAEPPSAISTGSVLWDTLRMLSSA